MFRLKILCLMILLIGVIGINVSAEETTKNPLQWLSGLEVDMIGKLNDGSGLVDRLSNLEEITTGRTFNDSVVERLNRLDSLMYVNQPHDVSLLYKIQALEWVLFKRSFSGPIQTRLGTVEKSLFDTAYAGPITKRLEKLINQVFPDGMIKGKWVTVTEGTLVKVKMVNELDSAQSKPGTRFQFEVVESVFVNDFVVFPQGLTGDGTLEAVNRPENWGRDAKLMLDFAEIKALDGTPVAMIYGSKARSMDYSRRLSVGASAAGMIAFGPGGILLGFAVKGKEKKILQGTEFYLQVKEPVRIYTIQ
jgi:hypothetical protein